ncbi:MAG: hypothetical protein WBZ51_06945, partial [Xanthobacteraceae bacterium]
RANSARLASSGTAGVSASPYLFGCAEGQVSRAARVATVERVSITVMRGLVPAIHAWAAAEKTWMRG